MLNRLNGVSVAASLPYFVTATLPDDVFDDDAARFAMTAKRLMAAFLKRVNRVAPDACGFWRIEWQARKSGDYKGKLAPHFHLLVWGLPERYVDDNGHILHGDYETEGRLEAFVECRDHQQTLEFVNLFAAGSAKRSEAQCRVESHTRFGTHVLTGKSYFVHRVCDMLGSASNAAKYPDEPASELARNMRFSDWASLAWYHVVDSHNLDHFAAGMRVSRVRSWGGVMSYCAKYMAKKDADEFLPTLEFGRSWGIFNRKCVPWAKMIDLPLDDDMGVRLRRLARRYLESKRGRRVRAPYGITLYCDVANIRRFWERPPPDPF